MLVSGTQDCGFDPGRSRRIFREKNPQLAFAALRRVKVPRIYLEVGLSGEIWSAISRPYFLTEISHADWHGEPPGMNGETKNQGLEYKRP
jgi:hypothetical protein